MGITITEVQFTDIRLFKYVGKYVVKKAIERDVNMFVF